MEEEGKREGGAGAHGDLRGFTGDWARGFGRSSPSQTRTRQEVAHSGRGGGFDGRPARSDSNGETRGEAEDGVELIPE